jgi:hypothetical protein
VGVFWPQCRLERTTSPTLSNSIDASTPFRWTFHRQFFRIAQLNSWQTGHKSTKELASCAEGFTGRRPIKIPMATTIAQNGVTRYFLEALGKFATARLRQVGAARIHPEWEDRAEVCERCSLRVVSCGVSFCGNPFLKQLDRDPAVDGCGCPCRDKAKSPGEHCPVDAHYQATEQAGGECNCKWCRANSKLESRRAGTNRNSKLEEVGV